MSTIRKHRPLLTVLGFAGATALASLTAFWPGTTHADPPEVYYGGGEISNVSFQGEVVKDAKAKTGWAIQVTLENTGDQDETCPLETDLTRQVVNPASRAGEMGTAVWRHKDKVLVPAHEKIVKTYEVPAWTAAQLTANEKAQALREKQQEAESNKPQPNYAMMMRPYTMYGVAFQKANA
jgi:hypothetical protein